MLFFYFFLVSSRSIFAHHRSSVRKRAAPPHLMNPRFSGAPDNTSIVNHKELFFFVFLLATFFPGTYKLDKVGPAERASHIWVGTTIIL